MKIAIVADSNSGVTQDEAKELGIYVLPMPFMIDGQVFYEGIDLTQGWRKGLKSPHPSHRLKM